MHPSLSRRITVIGAGAYGEVVAELAVACGYYPVAFCDDDRAKIGGQLEGLPVLGPIEDVISRGIEGESFVVAIGRNKVRRRIASLIRRYGGVTPSLVHPKAMISPSAQLGVGLIIHVGAVVWTQARICDDCILSPNVVVAHHSEVGPGSLISTLASIGSSIVIEDEAFVGMGATIMTGVRSIGREAIIGAGSVVIRDVPQGTVVVGVPAKPLVREK